MDKPATISVPATCADTGQTGCAAGTLIAIAMIHAKKPFLSHKSKPTGLDGFFTGDNAYARSCS